MYALPVEFNKSEDVKGGVRRWELSLYVDRHFDSNVPFRQLLVFITESVRSQGIDADLLLPDYDPWEDFVEGTLKIQSLEICVYFEYSLSYLSLIAEQLEGLQIVEACTHGKVFRHEGNGLPDDVQS